jgi:hypothetical protein
VAALGRLLMAGPMADRDAQIMALAGEFPEWESWQGLVNGLWHARKLGTTPPVLVHGESPDDLRQQIAYLTGGLP